jgi:hypothetical protein
MRPRPKIYQPNLSSLASLTLALFGLVFTLCYDNPNFASASLLRETFWWGPVLAFLALADCGVEKFGDPKNKAYPVLAFLVSGFQFLFLLIFTYRYFTIDGTSGGTYLAPRIGAILALFALAGVSVYFKTLRLRASPSLTDPLAYPSYLGLIAGLGLVAFALVVWSIDASQERAWGGEFYPVFVALLAGAAEIGDSFYVLESKEKPLEEKELVTRMVISFVGAGAALVAIFITIGFYDAAWLSWILFYWTLFASVSLCLLSAAAGAYYAYVSYRLKN